MNTDALRALIATGDILGPERCAQTLFGVREYATSSGKRQLEMRWEAEAAYNALTQTKEAK